MEELHMRRRHGEAYDRYRRSAPFLLPLPRIVEKFFVLPFRALFKKETPDRKGEVAVVLSLYGVVLIGASAFFYGRGLERTAELITPAERQEARMEAIATQLVDEPNRRAKYFIAGRLAAFGDPAVDYFIPLLENAQVEVRILAADFLSRLPSERAVPALIAALGDSVANVRVNALSALGAIGSAECVETVLGLLEDPEPWVRRAAMRSLAELGVEEIVELAEGPLQDPDKWTRLSTIESLGILGSERAVPLIAAYLDDEDMWVRRSAVVALLKIGSPRAREGLTRALNDEDWEVRLYANEALQRLGPESSKNR